MTTGKTIALIGGTFVGKVMSLLSNMLSRDLSGCVINALIQEDGSAQITRRNAQKARREGPASRGVGRIRTVP